MGLNIDLHPKLLERIKGEMREEIKKESDE